MRRHLNVLPKDQVQPSPSHCQFFPKLSGILSHIYHTYTRNRFSKIDQENISEKINQWKSSNLEDFFFFFRPYGEVSSGSLEEDSNPEERASNTLLFVHQIMWQRRPLKRYANHMCLMDATYKTTCYALSLFFLVQTNVGYQEVGSFVIKHESSQCFKEALQILQKETNKWSPNSLYNGYLWAGDYSHTRYVRG